MEGRVTETVMYRYICLLKRKNVKLMSLPLSVNVNRRASHTGTQSLHLWSPG